MATNIVELTGDEAKLLRSLQKVIEKQKASEDGFKKVGRAAKKAGDDGVRSADRHKRKVGEISDTVTKLAATYGTVTTAINIARQAMQFFKEESDRAKASFSELDETSRRLAQVSLTPEQRARQERERNRLAVEFAVPRAQVQAVQFAGISEGFGREGVREILRASPAISTEAATTVAGQFPGLFKGSGLTAAQAINLTQEAARQSRAGFEDIARAIPIAAEGAAAIASTPTETAATLAVLSGSFASPLAAAARIRAFGSKLALDPKFRGLSLLESAEALQRLPEAERREITGTSQEISAAFRRITENIDLIRERQGLLETAVSATGTEDSPVARAVKAKLQSPEGGARERARRDLVRSQIEREIARERRAEGAFRREAIINREIARLEGAPARQFTAQQVGQAAEFMQLSPENTSSAMEGTPSGIRAAAGRALPMLSGLIDLFSGPSQKLNQAADNLQRQSDVGANQAAADRERQRGAE